MVHVQSLNYTSRRYHTRMCKEVGEWKYPVICSVRKGWFRPYHAQVYLDDWRLPDICAEQFCSDMAFQNPAYWVESGNKAGFNKTNVWLVKLVVWAMNKFGPWRKRKLNKLVPMYKNTGWKYNLLLGVVDDPTQITRNDGKRKEVL